MRPRFTFARRKILLVNLITVAAILALTEAALYNGLRRPAWIPGFALGAARRLYWEERTSIQMLPACGQYDPELTYTLRPGTCTFSGPEFSNAYSVNRLGLRDDDASLVAPDVIVLGDSHSMGWGVDQQDTFPQVLEARTGLKVLNAGISSYGTARELLTMKRLDTSRLKLLVIQYCENDGGENARFLEAGNTVQPMSLDGYNEGARRDAEEHSARYAPGRYLWRLATLTWNSLGDRDSGEPHPGSLFVNVLMNSGVTLEGIPIVVFEVRSYGGGSKFLGQLQAELSKPSSLRPPWSIKVIDMASALEPSRYHRLDGHPNKDGHRKMAEVLIQAAGLPER